MFRLLELFTSASAGSQTSEAELALALSQRAFDSYITDFPLYIASLKQGASLRYTPRTSVWTLWESFCSSRVALEGMAVSIAFCQDPKSLVFSNSRVGVTPKNKALLIPLLQARCEYEETLEKVTELEAQLLREPEDVTVKETLAESFLLAAKYWLNQALSVPSQGDNAAFIRAQFVEQMLMLATQAFYVSVYATLAPGEELQKSLSLSHYYRMAQGHPIQTIFDETFRDGYLQLDLTIGSKHSASERAAFAVLLPASPASTRSHASEPSPTGSFSA